MRKILMLAAAVAALCTSPALASSSDPQTSWEQAQFQAEIWELQFNQEIMRLDMIPSELVYGEGGEELVVRRIALGKLYCDLRDRYVALGLLQPERQNLTAEERMTPAERHCPMFRRLFAEQEQ